MREFKHALVYHVGMIDKGLKNKDSYEGSGLSVSLEPKAWRRIARLGGNPTRCLYNPKGKFLDYYSLTNAEKSEIIQWGLLKGLIEQTKIYYFTYYDDEYEEEYEMVFTDKQTGIENAEAYESPLQERAGILGTPKLNEVSYGDMVQQDNHALEQLIIYYVEQHFDYDGIWWNEQLDVYKLSAPRGVIFNSKLGSWRIYSHISEYLAQVMLQNTQELAKQDKYHQRRNAKLAELKVDTRINNTNIFRAQVDRDTWAIVAYNQLAIGTENDYTLYTYPNTSYTDMLNMLSRLNADSLYNCILAQRLR